MALGMLILLEPENQLLATESLNHSSKGAYSVNVWIVTIFGDAGTASGALV